MKLIYLEWEDACDNSSVWRTEKEVLEWGENVTWWVKQAGFLIKETKKEIILAGSMEPGNKDYEATFKNLTRIPKTWIRKRKIIKL